MTITQGERYYATASRNAGVQVELYRGELRKLEKVYGKNIKKGGEEDRGEGDRERE